jgi:hypothetical protein
MVNDYQRILNDSRYGQTRQVTDVVGESALKRVEAIDKINQVAGRQIDKAAQSLKGVKVDVTREVDEFTDSLAGIGVKIEPTSKGVKINYKDSDFEGMKKSQKVINNVVSRMYNTKSPNAYDVHRMKKFIDNNVTFGGGKTGAEGKAESLIKGLRRNLDGYLDGISKNYDKANTKYADTVTVLNDVKGVAGKNGINARTLGLLANRVDSRAVSSARIGDIYSSLDDVAAKYGVRFKDSVSDLHIIANSIDNTLPNVVNNSLQGQVGNAASKALDKGAELSQSTVFGSALRAGKAGIDKFSKDKSVNAQIKALKDLLRSNVAFEQ